jgi:hypothetical protein
LWFIAFFYLVIINWNFYISHHQWCVFIFITRRCSARRYTQLWIRRFLMVVISFFCHHMCVSRHQNIQDRHSCH